MKKPMINVKFDLLKQLLFSIKEVYRSSPILFMVSTIITLINSFSSYALLFFSKVIIDNIDTAIKMHISIQDAISNIIIWIALSAAVSLALVFINYLNSIITQKQQLKFNQYIDAEMARKSISLDISYFDHHKFYDDIRQAREGKERLMFIFGRCMIFLQNIISLIIAFILAITNIKIIIVAIVILFSIPPFFTRTKFYNRLFYYENDNQKAMRKIGYLAGIILGKNTAKEIRFYDMSDFITNRYEKIWVNYSKNKKNIVYKFGIIDSIINVIPTIGIATSMFFITKNIVYGQRPIGDFTYLLGILNRLQSSFVGLVEDLAKMAESSLSIEKYNNFMNFKPKLMSNGNKLISEIDTIEFQNVCFSYEGNDHKVLDNINFIIEKNQKVAIVGVNGAGKTTIIKLLLRFYDVCEGQILLNGIDIRDYNIESLRKCFSTVFQDFLTYSLSIRDNVSFSNYEKRDRDDDIIRALKISDLEKGILDRVSNLDIDISKDFSSNGLELSGGQKQKLAVARCIFRGANVVILDEPTASLDPIAEHDILEQFKKIYTNSGLIMISHRLSNTVLMDKIIVVENGKVIESGSHKDLIEIDGRYSYLFKLQSEKYVNEVKS